MTHYRILGIWLGATALGVFFALSGPPTDRAGVLEDSAAATEKARLEAARRAGRQAYVMCQVFVERRLKAPRTAKFPPTSAASISPLGDGRFRVSAYVDSENSFGAMLRNNYECAIRSVDGDRWRLEALRFDER